MLSLDTETTGLDLYHGAAPFFVTTCRDDGETEHWRWDVDPLTREVKAAPGDVEEIRTKLEIIAGWGRATSPPGRPEFRATDKVPDPEVRERHALVLQNAKFDAKALHTVGVDNFPWAMVRDTMVAGHLLSSNTPHNLTDMATQWLGVDIQPLEKALEKACVECRTWARRHRPKWKIAKQGLEGMPSAKEKCWKYDGWLPYAVAAELGHPESHHYWTVLEEYANADSSTTIALWRAMRAEVVARGLWPIFEEKMKSVPALLDMENYGTTVLATALVDMADEYEAEMAKMSRVCENVAAGMSCALRMPRSGNNQSLTDFAFGPLKLPALKLTETGRPSLDKDVLEEYKRILPDGSKQLLFVRSLSRARKRAKSVEFLNAYAAHGLPPTKNGRRAVGMPADGGVLILHPSIEDVLILHPSINPTATATTRVSMSNPNLQQVSKQESQCERCLGEGCGDCDGTGEDLHSVRRCFGPAPGREWWSFDAKNIELRIPAYESGEPDLIELFEHPDDPPFYGSQHMLNLSIVYKDVWDEEVRAVGLDKAGPSCKKKYASGPYHWTKCGGLAMQYQCGERTADKTFRRAGAFRLLKAHFGNVKRLNDRVVAFAEEHGYVETIPDKSVCPERGYPLLCARGNYGRVLSTVPLNYRTQGTAGWWMVKAVNRCHALLRNWRARGFDGWMVLTVHDELVFDFPKRGDPVAETKRGTDGGAMFRTSNLWRAWAIQRLMEKGGEDVGVPTPVSCEYHPVCWAEGVSV